MDKCVGQLTPMLRQLNESSGEECPRMGIAGLEPMRGRRRRASQ